MTNATRTLTALPTFFSVDECLADLDRPSGYLLPDSAVAELRKLLGNDAATLGKIRELSDWCGPAEKSASGEADTPRLRYESIAKASAQILADLSALSQDLHLINGVGANLDVKAPYRRPALFITDLNSVFYLRRGEQELKTLWQSLYTLNRTAMDLAVPSGKRGRRQGFSRIFAVIAIGHWFGNVLGRRVTISRDGEFARTLGIVLPYLGHSCPVDLLPLMRTAKRLWKLGARIPAK